MALSSLTMGLRLAWRSTRWADSPACAPSATHPQADVLHGLVLVEAAVVLAQGHGDVPRRGHDRLDLQPGVKAQGLDAPGVEGIFSGHHEPLADLAQGQDIVLVGQVGGDLGQHLGGNLDILELDEGNAELVGEGQVYLILVDQVELHQDAPQVLAPLPVLALQGQAQLAVIDQARPLEDLPQAGIGLGRCAADDRPQVTQVPHHVLCQGHVSSFPGRMCRYRRPASYGPLPRADVNPLTG